MWCGRKGIDCPYCGVFGECQRSACGSPNIETSTLGTSSSYLVNTISEEFITDIKRQAVKEFAEKLEKKSFDKNPFSFKDLVDSTNVVLVTDIDELLKEYEE